MKLRKSKEYDWKSGDPDSRRPVVQFCHRGVTVWQTPKPASWICKVKRDGELKKYRAASNDTVDLVPDGIWIAR